MASVPIILYGPRNGVKSPFATFTIKPKSVNKSIKKLTGQYNELFLEFKMNRT